MNVVVLVAICAVLVVLLALLFVFLSFFKYWLAGFLAGTPVSMPMLLGMTLRKTRLGVVVPAGIMANQAGCRIPWNELESAHLQGVDIHKVVTAYIAAKRRNESFTFQELVDAEREDRLAKMLDF